jgi:arginase
MSIALLGVPTNSSGTPDGVARAPQALRAAGLVARLRRVGPFVDLGDIRVDEPSPVRGLDAIIDTANLAATLARVRARIADARRAGHLPVVVGGDCPILIGALAGCAEASGRPPGLLFVDGHEDAWPPMASTTGEAADMELGLLLGRALDGVEPALLAQVPRLDPANVAVLGVRDRAELDAAGVASLDGTVTVLHDAAVRADPATAALDAVRRVASASGWWLHVDLDVLSTEALPAVDYRQDGGLAWSDLTELTSAAIDVGGCLGATVTIYNPDLDPDARHARAIVEFIGGLADGLERRASGAHTRGDASQTR